MILQDFIKWVTTHKKALEFTNAYIPLVVLIIHKRLPSFVDDKSFIYLKIVVHPRLLDYYHSCHTSVLAFDY